MTKKTKARENQDKRPVILARIPPKISQYIDDMAYLIKTRTGEERSRVKILEEMLEQVDEQKIANTRQTVKMMKEEKGEKINDQK